MRLNNNNSLLKFTLIGLTFSLSGLFACMFFSSDNNTAFAQQQRQLQTLSPTQNVTTTNATNTLSLTGTATTTVKPDKVTVSLGVETTNKTADIALTANSKIMNQVLGALKSAGVRGNETSTSSFSISPNYNYSQPSSTASRITGFTVSNTIQIQSTNINHTSKWIDAAIAAGANTVDRIDFALSDKKLEESKNNLIKQAMQDARAKADILASAAGVKVVGIRSISLNELAIQPPPSIPLAKQSLAAEARPTPIMSGQEEVTTNMGVIFLIQ
jgi:uncharacterized protein YggE